MIGLGRLGLPVSCAMALRGHTVYGYEKDKGKANMYRSGTSMLYEPEMDKILVRCLNGTDSGIGKLIIAEDLDEAVTPSQVIFIAVPTPSLPNGAFDNKFVIKALEEVATEMLENPTTDYKVIAIISTVLPGTTRNDFYPALHKMLGPPDFNGWGVVYNAQFIAMGSVIDDMLRPEFVLVGGEDERAQELVERFYKELVDAPVLKMSYEEAEITKLVYNTFIGQKIVTGNAIMEVCEKIGHADCDVVTSAIALARKRILSDWYLKGGMGDGGNCHPRDARALDYFSKTIGLSANPFGFVSEAREKQSKWLAKLIKREQERRKLPVVIMGLTFKHNTNLTTDSPAILLMEQLEDMGVKTSAYDPVVMPSRPKDVPSIYFIATRWVKFSTFPYAKGSLIIDPWGFFGVAPEGCELFSIGRNR